MGDSQKYFEFNPTEARRLLEAAGHRGLSARFNYIATPQYGSVFPNVGEAFIGLLNADGNFNLTQGNPDYQTEYLPAYYFAKGDFDGIAWGACTTYPHVGQHLLEYYHSQGGRQKIAFMNDPSTVEGTAASDDVISRMMQSLDFEEQVSLIQQWQRENASRMPIVPSPWPGGIGGFGATWPWAMNLGSFRDYLESAEQATLIHWWLDPATTPRT
jgi:ABC-type transport system substrate-binding protein